MNTLLYYSHDFFKFSTKKQRKLTTTKCQKCDCNFSDTVTDRNALLIIAHDSDEALKV